MVVVIPQEAVRIEGGRLVADPGVWYGQENARKYIATISRKVIESGPTWIPSQPLPLSLDRAVALARTALTNLVPEPNQWGLSEVCLQRLRKSVPQRWFFVIQFTRESGGRSHQGNVYIPVAFTGHVGTVKKAKP